MSDTPSLTPSEDNRRNMREEIVSLAIEQAMNNKEQSRDELLNSFTVLKKDDVDKNILKGPGTPSQDIMKNILSNTQRLGCTAIDATSFSDKCLMKQLSDKSSTEGNIKVDEDGVEEEILDEGTEGSWLSKARIINTGTNLKVDNFVENEERDGDTLVEGYVASFSEDKNKGTHVINTNTAEDRTKQDPTNFPPSQQLDENSIDRLLMNFLADFQNEQNTQNDSNIQKRNELIQESPENSIDSFIRRNRKQEDVIDFSADGDDASLSLVDNSDDKNVRVIVNHQELHEITKPESSDETSPSEFKIRMVMDSEGNMCEDLGDSNSMNPGESMADVVFPGEIVDTETLKQATNSRLLDFKVRYKCSSDSSSVTTESNVEGGSLDEVEPFCLDENFDYDNVVLTPKYSEADMARLQNILQTKTAIL